jgi:hypothetical protein
VRTAAFLAILALGVVAIAEEPASKQKAASQARGQQLFGMPDMSREFNLQQMTPFGRSKSDFQARGANTNSFYIQQKFQPKGYETTDSFRTKSAWDGNFKFSTKDARTRTFDTKTAPPAKTAPVKEAYDSGKTATTRDFAPGHKTSPFKGRNQALFDKDGPAAQAKIGQSWNGNLNVLTLEDVREILNKNK